MLRDLRYALRTLRRKPGFTAAAVLTLALGIGANSTIFSVVNWVLWRPLPVADGDRLAVVYSRPEGSDFYGPFSHPDYLDFKRETRAFTDLIEYQPLPLGLDQGGTNGRVWGEVVSANYFSFLGVRPALGRGFDASEAAAPGAAPVTIVSHAFWKSRLGGDPHVVGQTLRLNGQVVTVVGVAPESFRSIYYVGFSPELWIPVGAFEQLVPGTAGTLALRTTTSFRLMGKLRPGVTVEQAQAQVSAVARRLAEAYPATNRGLGAEVIPEKDSRPEPSIARGFARVASVFLAVVGLVLLVACANLAGLLLARAAERRKEIGVRLAIGAGRAALIRQLLTESAVLSLAGAAAGLLLTYGATHALAAIRLPSDLPFRFDFSIDERVLVFTLGVAVLTSVAFGLVPALQASRPDTVEALKGSGASLGTVGRSRLRAFLVIGQVAVSLVLLVCAGLFLRTLETARKVDPGFDPRGLLLLTVDPGLQGYDETRARAFYRDLVERAGRVPGLRAATLAQFPQLEFSASGGSLYVDGRPTADGPPETVARITVGPDFFETLRTRLEEGRPFTPGDSAGAPPVVIVNRTAERAWWPGQSAIGKTVRLNMPDSPPAEVIGVAQDGKVRDLFEKPQALVYLPLAQNYTSSATLIARTAGDPRQLIGPLRAELRRLDPDMPAFDVKTYEELIAGRSLLPVKLASSLAGAFGLLALVLAAVGLYGVVSFAVSQRVREIGLRMALGADRGSVVRDVLRHGTRLTLAGLGVGLAGALAAGPVLASLLAGVSPRDPVLIGSVATLLSAVALLATWIPARRAARLDPLRALRCE
jgi:predicted permease